MLKIGRIHLDYQANPVGLDHVPQVGWEIESDRRNTVQRTYRLQVALDPLFESLCYDSGRVESTESAHVCARGLEIRSADKYFVRVRISDGVEESGWSAPASFVTALLKKEEWRAPFVSAENQESDKECSKGTYVRGTFLVRKKVKAAYAFTTALGLYNFYLNGKKVGEDEMTPGWTSYRKHLMYQTYDITDLLKPGINVAGAMLGAGWFKGVMGLTKARNNYGDRTAFAMQAVLHYEDGTSEIVTTDSSWAGSDSPVVFAEIYDGETYDASLEIPDWCCAEHPVVTWHPVDIVPWDVRVLCAQSGSRVKMIDKMPVKRLFKTPKGETVLDFGQNMTGRIHVTASGKPGDVIELRCFEVLDSEGNVYLANLRGAKTTMKYIFGKTGTITWHPCFTYMGFRYAVIYSFPGTPKAENFTAYTLHSEMEPTGNIVCSNPLLNQLHHNYLWGLKGNFLDVPTDCPQRDERLGWTGDAQIFCRTACYLRNTYTFYSKWLADVVADQTPEGGVPHVIPNIEDGKTDGNWLLSQGPHSAAAWADVAVILPWTLYLMYGDKAVLERQYDSMKAWIDFMKNHSDDYIWNYKLQFGDWVALDAEPGSYFGATPNDLTCTAYFAYSTGLFIKMASALGKKDVVAEYCDLYHHIVKKYQETFFDADGNLTAQTQTAHIVSLYFGLTPKPYLQKTVEGLRRLLAKENGHLVTGFVGTPYFCHALSQNGCVDEAYRLLLKEDYPSWLYQVKKGATTIWEHWDGLKPDGTMWSPDMNSFNHYAYGAIGEWMYRVMAGIEADEKAPGFRHTLIFPRIGGNLNFVDAFYHSIYGNVGVKWETSDSKVSMTVQVPANTTATIRLDRAETLLETSGLNFQKKDGSTEAETGSGTYRVVYLRKP
jgi:alpha-L-rhamnosidase